MTWDFDDIAEWIAEDFFGWLPGRKSIENTFGNDLVFTLTKAHLGKLPKGQYAEQYISAKTFSRDALRVPLDAETLRRMDACAAVHEHDVQFRLVSVRKGIFSGKMTISLSMTLRFEGETAGGEQVSVSIGHALLMAFIERDKVRGMALRTLKEVK